MKMGAQYFSHGKITLDNKSSFTEGKEIECPECKHKFIWDKFFCLSPRYPRSWYKKNNKPYGFSVEMEVNTPSVDESGRGDRLPRISYIIYGCKLTIEDRVNEWENHQTNQSQTEGKSSTGTDSTLTNTGSSTESTQDL